MQVKTMCERNIFVKERTRITQTKKRRKRNKDAQLIYFSRRLYSFDFQKATEKKIA